MAFLSLTQGQVDADSPINETLMDLIRTNLDDLDSRIVGATSEGVVKGWINFNGVGTISIRDSFNVAGIVDNGVGSYTINWDTDFIDSNYCVNASAQRQNTGSNNGVLAVIGVKSGTSNLSVGSTPVVTTNLAGGNEDSPLICLMAIGDQ